MRYISQGGIQMKVVKISRSECIVIVCFILYIFSSVIRSTIVVLSNSALNNLMKYTDYIVLMGLLVSFLLGTHYRIKRIRLLIFLGLCCLCALVIVFNKTMVANVLMFLFILCGINLKSEMIFKTYFVEMIILLTTVFLCAKIGIIQNYSSYSERGYRQFLGFSYTTILPNMFFHSLLILYSLKRKKLKVIEIILISGINLLLYKLTYTRAVLFEVFFFLLLLILERFRKNIFAGKIMRIGFTLAMPALAVLMFLLSFCYTEKSATFRMLNEILTDRLSLGQKAISLYGLHPFGTKVEWSVGVVGLTMRGGEEYLYVDSSYLNGLLTYGYVFMIFILVGFALLNYKKHFTGDYKYCICLLLLSIHCFSDPQLLSVKYNPFLVAVGISVFSGIKPSDKLKAWLNNLLRYQNEKSEIIKS